MKSTRRSSDSPVHRPEKTPRFQIQLDKWPLTPRTPREASGVPCLNPRRGLTLLSQSAGTLRSESEIRGTLRFLPHLEMRPSPNAPNPGESREAPPTSSFPGFSERSDEHTSELQSPTNLVCRLLLETKNKKSSHTSPTQSHNTNITPPLRPTHT